MRTNYNTLAHKGLSVLLAGLLGGGALLASGCKPETGSSGGSGGGGGGDAAPARHVSDMGRPKHNDDQGKKNSLMHESPDCTYMQAEAVEGGIHITAKVSPMPAGPILKYTVQSSEHEIEGRRRGNGISVEGDTITTTISSDGVGRDPRAFVKIEFPIGTHDSFGGVSCDSDGV